ncbi:hypothetical protein BDN71DRAFT_1022866 [Pleurotus eryngii]|uniref:Uncharacterized protein n=1 Tax=Pleurotus eryngii TaxID=5323 RepID=A0A9P6D5V7_PLEER|nr:hypothetical protein BDN71DRAFT_1022866 [Pleurotus eryngii]
MLTSSLFISFQLFKTTGTRDCAYASLLSFSVSVSACLHRLISVFLLFPVRVPRFVWRSAADLRICALVHRPHTLRAGVGRRERDRVSVLGTITSAPPRLLPFRLVSSRSILAPSVLASLCFLSGISMRAGAPARPCAHRTMYDGVGNVVIAALGGGLLGLDHWLSGLTARESRLNLCSHKGREGSARIEKKREEDTVIEDALDAATNLLATAEVLDALVAEKATTMVPAVLPQQFQDDVILATALH